MVTISVKDYNELVRNSGDKRVLELLTIIVNYANKEQETVGVTRTRFDAIGMLRNFIEQLQSKEQSFEEIMEWTKRNFSNEKCLNEVKRDLRRKLLEEWQRYDGIIFTH